MSSNTKIFYLCCSIPILIPTGMFCIFRLAGKLSILNVYILLLPSKTEPALGFIHHFHSFSFLNHDLTACSFKSLTGDRIGSGMCTSGVSSGVSAAWLRLQCRRPLWGLPSHPRGSPLILTRAARNSTSG